MYDSADTKPTSGADPVIDLRSDTVTKPSPAMRKAMFEAEVGDDVYAEDPTINRLEKRAAEVFGREAALFVPSGTMGNQIAIKLHTTHGQEVICEERGHVFNYEMAMMAHFSGVVPRTIWAEDGILTWKHVSSKLKGKSYHAAKTGLVSLENTHNMAGGTVTALEVFEEVCDRVHEAGLPVHLDGARVFNASVTLGSFRGSADRQGRHSHVLPVEGIGRACRLHAGRQGRRHRSRTHLPQGLGRRNAAGRGFLLRPGSSRWKKARRSWPPITPTRSISPKDWPKFGASRLIRRKFRPTL